MKYNFVSGAILGMVLLTSCTSSHHIQDTVRFPGFVQISNTGPGSKFFIDIGSIKQDPNEITTFKLLQILPDGYAIQDAVINSNDEFVSSEGIKYSQDGTAADKFSGVTVSVDEEQHSGLVILVKFVHEQVMAKKSFSGNFDDVKALQALYGTYRPDLNGVIRKEISLPSDAMGQYPTEGIARVFLSQDFKNNNQNKHVILVATKPDGYDCHACSPLVSGAIFSQDSGRWQLESEYPLIDIPAGYGNPPKCRWQQIGDNNYCLVTEDGYLSNGELYIGATIVRLYNGIAHIILKAGKEFESEKVDLVDAPPLTFDKSDKLFWDALFTLRHKIHQEQNVIYRYVYQNDMYRLQNTDSTGVSQPVLTSSPEGGSRNGVSSHTTKQAKKHKQHMSGQSESPTQKAQGNAPTGELDPRIFLDH